jgi:hypothetical protein
MPICICAVPQSVPHSLFNEKRFVVSLVPTYAEYRYFVIYVTSTFDFGHTDISVRASLLRAPKTYIYRLGQIC